MNKKEKQLKAVKDAHDNRLKELKDKLGAFENLEGFTDADLYFIFTQMTMLLAFTPYKSRDASYYYETHEAVCAVFELLGRIVIERHVRKMKNDKLSLIKRKPKTQKKLK